MFQYISSPGLIDIYVDQTFLLINNDITNILGYITLCTRVNISVPTSKISTFQAKLLPNHTPKMLSNTPLPTSPNHSKYRILVIFKSLPIWKINILICISISINKVSIVCLSFSYRLMTLSLVQLGNQPFVTCYKFSFNFLLTFSSAYSLFYCLGNFSILPIRGLEFYVHFEGPSHLKWKRNTCFLLPLL